MQMCMYKNCCNYIPGLEYDTVRTCFAIFCPVDDRLDYFKL